MKSLSKHLLVALLCLTSAVTYSQSSGKPHVFANQASRLEISESIFINAMNYSAGQNVSINIAPGFTFEGTVTMSEQKYENLKTVVIRSNAAFDNSFLQISKIKNEDGSVQYSGRIINERSADGFELKKEAGLYAFEKFETARILQDCNY